MNGMCHENKCVCQTDPNTNTPLFFGEECSLRECPNVLKNATDKKSVYASIVRQLKDICDKQRRLFGSVIEDIEDLFDAIDVNGDGALSVDEIQKGLRRLDLGLDINKRDNNNKYKLVITLYSFI